MKKGLKITSVTNRINVGLPIDDRYILSSLERSALAKVRRYKWMIVVDEDSGTRYQLQPPVENLSETDLSLWLWHAIDSSAVLSEPLYVSQQVLGIPSNTVYPSNTPIETIIRKLVEVKRNPIYPSISATSLNLVEKGTSGTVQLQYTKSIGDSNGWIAGDNFYKKDGVSWIDINNSVYSYSNIQNTIEFKITSEYYGVTVEEKPILNNDLSDGVAEALVNLNPVLPYFIGRSIHPNFNPNTLDQSFFQSELNDKLALGNSYYAMSFLTNPVNQINIPYDFWCDKNFDDTDFYMWIAIPVSWNKSINEYYVSANDFGIVGEGSGTVWSVVNVFTINSPKASVNWNTQDYIVYSTAYRTNSDYTPNNLFNFKLV